MKRRLLSLLVSAAMIVSLLPVQIAAAETASPAEGAAPAGTAAAEESHENYIPCGYTFTYRGVLDKLYDTMPVSFDPALLEVTETASGLAKQWSELETAGFRIGWCGENGAALREAPLLPGTYRMLVQKPDDTAANGFVNVAGVPFRIRQEAVRSQDGTYTLKLFDVLEDSDVSSTELVGTLCITAEGTITGLDQAGAENTGRQRGSLRLPDSFIGDGQEITVRAIGSEALRGLSARKVLIPKTVNAIADTAFIQQKFCEQIEVSAENTAYQSQDGMLMNKEGTQILVCPIGFAGPVVIPEGVTKIDRAFRQCAGLTRVQIPASLTRFNPAAEFGSAESVEAFTVTEGNPVFTAENGFLIRDDHTLALCPNAAQTIRLPHSVTAIAPNAFLRNYDAQIIIDSPGIRFEKNAFANLVRATVITGDGTVVENIDPEAFGKARLSGIEIRHPGPKYASVNGMLTSADHKTLLHVPSERKYGAVLRIPDAVETIASGAFTEIKSLPDIVMEHVHSIESGAFTRSVLGNIYISDEMKKLGRYIIREPGLVGENPSPVNIWYEGSEEQWNAIPGSNQLYDPSERPYYPSYRQEGSLNAEGHPDSVQAAPLPAFVLNVYHNARKMDLKNCSSINGKYASVGSKVYIIPLGGRKVVDWRVSPQTSWTVGKTPYGQPCITFTMPNADLRIAPLFEEGAAVEIPIQRVELAAPQEPVPNEAPGAITADADAPYTVESVSWSTAIRGKKDGELTYTPGSPVTGALVKDEPYMAEVTLAPKAGYSFAHDYAIEAFANGKKAYSFRQADEKLMVTCLCLPLYPVTVKNGLSAGEKLTYDPADNSSVSWYPEGATIRTWPVFKENWIYYAMSNSEMISGTRSGYGQGERYFKSMRKEPASIEYGPKTTGPDDPAERVIHVLHGSAYPGADADTNTMNGLNSCRPGEKVTLKAATYPLEGYHFDHWVVYDSFNPNPDGVNPGGITPEPSTSVILQDPRAEQTWFTMPDHEVFAEAIYEKNVQRFALYLEDAHVASCDDPGAIQNGDGSWMIRAGAAVVLEPNNDPSNRFLSWKPMHIDVTMDGERLIMPNHTTTVRAEMQDVSRSPIKIAGGTVIDAEGMTVTSAVKGETLTLRCAELEEDQVFEGWEAIRGGVKINEDNTFVMESAEVEIRARIHTHEFGSWLISDDKKQHARVCSCGVIQTAPHSFTDWTVDKDGSTQHRTCIVCGYEETKTVETKPHVHTPGTEWHRDAVGHWKVCTTCGARLDYDVHSFTEWEEDPGQDRKSRTCCICGYTDLLYHPTDPTETTTVVKPGVFESVVTIPISSDQGEAAMVSYDEKASSAIARAAGSADAVRLRVDSTPDAVEHANESQAAALENTPGTVVSVELECLDSEGEVIREISDFEGGLCTVKIPAPVWLQPDKGMDHATVYRVEKDGTMSVMNDVRFVEENGQWFVAWFSGGHSMYVITGTDYYGRSKLNDREKRGYDLVGYGVTIQADHIDLSDCELSPDELGRVMTFYLNDHPEQYWLRGGYRYSYSGATVNSVMPNYEAPVPGAPFRDAAAGLLRAAVGKDSDYEKALALHDALVRHVTYDLSAPNAHSAYGAIAEGRAVCEGYARAYQYLLQQTGIQSYVVTGIAGGGGHAWNLVRLDGKYYYTDPTWDDPVIRGVNEAEKPVFYGYFNLSENDIESDHMFNALYEEIKPKAESSAMMFEDFAAMENLDSESISDNFHKLNEDGTRLVSRIYYTGLNAGEWLRQSYEAVAEAARIQGGYSVSWLICGREIYLTYQISRPQAYRPMEGQATKPRPTRPTNGRFAQPTLTTASKLMESVTVNLRKRVRGGNCLAAVYDENGRLLTMGMEPVAPGAESVTIHYDPFDPEVAASMQIFMTDRTSTPLYEEAYQKLGR